MPAVISRAKRLARIERFCTDEFADIAVQLREQPSGRLSGVYGGRWHKHESRWLDDWEISFQVLAAEPGEATERARLVPLVLDVHKIQRQLIEDFQTKMIMANGSRRSGKSRGGAYKVTVHAAAFPGVHGQVIAPTYPKVGIMWRYLLQTIPDEWIYQRNNNELWIELLHGVRIKMLSAFKPDSLIGEGVGWMDFDEFQGIRDKDFALALPALSDGGRAFQVWGQGTPRMGEYYSRYKKFKALERLGTNQARVLHFTYLDNCFVESGAGTVFDVARGVLDPSSVRTELEAEFESEEGLTYYRFDREVHDRSWRRDHLDLPSSKRWAVDVTERWAGDELECDAQFILGVDYGINRNFALVLKVIRAFGYVCIWAIDEVLGWKNYDTEALANDLIERGYYPAAIFDDASGPKDGDRSEHFRRVSLRRESEGVASDPKRQRYVRDRTSTGALLRRRRPLSDARLQSRESGERKREAGSF
jgi:hypothetical protein